MRTKVSGPESLELALVMKKKDCQDNTLAIFFTQLVHDIPDHFHGLIDRVFWCRSRI